MVTRFCVGTNRPTKRYACHVSSISPLLKSYTHAFNNPHWYRAMLDEYNALIKNRTWILAPRPHNVNIVRCLWFFGISIMPMEVLIVTRLALLRMVVLNSQRIITSLHVEFSMTDLGPLNYFLGVSVTCDTSGMFLSQQKYATEVLERAGMLTCNPCRTPVDTDSKLSADGDPVSDPTLYRNVAGALLYFTFTRLDADWASCPTTRRSTSGYCVFLDNNLLSWSSKRQFTISRSSTEVEYRGVTNVVAETCWLRNLLRKLHTPLSTATLVYYDNVSVVYLSSNPVQHQRTKHIEIDIHFVRDLVSTGLIRVLHVPSHYQYADDVKIEKIDTDDNLADPFTKALAFPKHSELTRNIGLLPASSFM
nr:ribonuclease H-like domain-containing protein [Tanacetum cinerariifolium]